MSIKSIAMAATGIIMVNTFSEGSLSILTLSQPCMPVRVVFALAFFLLQSLLCSTQYPPPVSSDSGITSIKSPVNNNITIQFKSPDVGTCTTVFPTQQQYAGYVSLPPYTLAPVQQNYSINTFFWFIEARTNTNTAPLTIYINGGPGSSSMVGLFQETGPCEVVEIAQGRLGTQARDWGWDRSSNVLYIDQPNQVGFSYDTPTKGSLDLFSRVITEPPSDAPLTLGGTFSSNSANSTANTTQIAAYTVWHMLQGFLGVFPQYNPGTRANTTQASAVGVNLFAESYGGKYGPAFASLWEKQNLLRRNGSISSNNTLEIHLTSLGIMQGCVDDLVQGRYYPIFANRNTYGINALSLADQENAASSYLSADGCQQLIQRCREAVAASDPQNEGDVAPSNQACHDALINCNDNVVGPFQMSGRDLYDITQRAPDPFPPSTYLEYLNEAGVQAAIGAPVNYTQSNNAVFLAFQQTGDAERGDQINQMASLLSLGVRVALIYGDRDYLCNWLGGEAVSFSIAAQSPAYAPFYSAGYADIVVNQTYVGGAVRQFGNLSFSRVYGAGHLVPAYQPETAFTIFTRVIMGNDVSLGDPVDLSTYKSNGTANATFTNEAPPQKSPTCWLRDIDAKCSNDQKRSLENGQGTIINGVLYDNEGDWSTPPSSVSTLAGYPGHVPSSTITTGKSPPTPGGGGTGTPKIPTGVFTATSTPSPTKSAAARGRNFAIPGALLGVWIALLGSYV